MHYDGAVLQVSVLVGLVDQHGHLLAAYLGGAVAEHEQHCVNDVRLSTPIRTNNGREALKGKRRRGQYSLHPLLDTSPGNSQPYERDQGPSFQRTI